MSTRKLWQFVLRNSARRDLAVCRHSHLALAAGGVLDRYGVPHRRVIPGAGLRFGWSYEPSAETAPVIEGLLLPDAATVK